MTQNNKSATIKAVLRKAGLKATPARLELLPMLEKAKQPLSIEEILASLGKGADKVTVYRNLKSFSEQGLVNQVNIKHGHADYEIAIQHHHHLICESCGKMVDIEKCDTSELEKEVKRIGKFAQVKSHSLEFFGICNSCAKN